MHIKLAVIILSGATVVCAAALYPVARDALAGSALVGDANCDGIVNAIDSTFILQLSAGLIITLPCPQNGDTNGDGVTNSVDSALILQLSAGLIDRLAPPPAEGGAPIQHCWIAVASYQLVNPDGLPSSPGCNVPGTGANYSCSVRSFRLSCDTFQDWPDYDCVLVGFIGNCNAGLSFDDPNYTCTEIGGTVLCITFTSGSPDYSCGVSENIVACSTAQSGFPSFVCSFGGFKFTCE